MRNHGANPRLYGARFACVCVALVLAAVLITPAQSAAAGADDSAALKEFKKNVDEYKKLHKKVEDILKPADESASAALLVKQKSQFAKTLQTVRADAAQGDIFTPAVRPLFLKIIKLELSGAAGAKARSMILGEGNPKGKEAAGSKQPRLKVNEIYPAEAPLSTVPPSLLLALPQLPEQIEYRFIGRHLILLDTAAGLVVDYITNAVP
jgi:hypothetical protein